MMILSKCPFTCRPISMSFIWGRSVRHTLVELDSWGKTMRHQVEGSSDALHPARERNSIDLLSIYPVLRDYVALVYALHGFDQTWCPLIVRFLITYLKSSKLTH
eukprot:277976-Karenia_brevis.AAC.1